MQSLVNPNGGTVDKSVETVLSQVILTPYYYLFGSIDSVFAQGLQI